MLLALPLGWYVDHRNLTEELQKASAERDSAVDTAIGATYRSTEAKCHILAERHAQKFAPGQLRHALQYPLLYDITEVWRDRDDINNVWENRAFNLTHDALLLLKIDSADKFMQICKNRYADAELWPEFHDTNHTDYDSIKEFVRESLDPKYASKWGW